MRRMFPAVWAVLLCLCMLAAFSGEAADAKPTAEPGWITTEDGNFPALTKAGFLKKGEFLYENPTDGIWRYCSTDLRVEVLRYQQTKPKLIWYEAEIWYNPQKQAWTNFPATEGKYVSKTALPFNIARKNGTVIGVNSDYAFGRYSTKNDSVGIFIRDGKVLSAKTKKTYSGKRWPVLDNFTIMPDGTWQVFHCTEHTAEEYLEMGCEDVYAFGPYLIRDGEINPDLMKASAARYNNPRTAVGMVEKGHCWLIVVEGRYNKSVGCKLDFLAQLFKDKGCTTAFNFDGGGTTCMIFMGNQISVAGGSKIKKGSARYGAELFGIGTTKLMTTD